MTTDNNEIQQKISTKFYCKKCDYKTSRKYNFDIHELSTKHAKNNETTTKISKNQQNLVKNNCFNCNKLFNDRAGLWRHKKKCINTESVIKENNIILNSQDKQTELIMMLVKENNEFKNMMMEVIKNGTNNNMNNNTNISNTN